MKQNISRVEKDRRKKWQEQNYTKQTEVKYYYYQLLTKLNGYIERRSWHTYLPPPPPPLNLSHSRSSVNPNQTFPLRCDSDIYLHFVFFTYIWGLKPLKGKRAYFCQCRMLNDRARMFRKYLYRFRLLK